ncbi:MAG: hypothetical protein ACRDIL_01145 [Candidatus Limnocylindrales bacterium]
MILAVRPIAVRDETAKLGGVSSGQVVGYEERAKTFEVVWPGVTVDHRLPIPEQGGIRAYHTDPHGPRTGSLPWRLSDGRTIVGEGWAYTYVDTDGRDEEVRDCCAIYFDDAVPALVGVVIYADLDDLADMVRELEVIPLAVLVGSDDLPLPGTDFPPLTDWSEIQADES